MSFLDRIQQKGFIQEVEKYNFVVVFLRLLSLPIVKFSIKFNLHPNLLTLTGFFSGLVSIYFLYVNINYLFIFFWSLSCILDYADGTLARITKKVSHFGYLFDMISDRVKLILLIAICLSIYNETFLFQLGVIAITLQVLSDFILHIFIPHNNLKSTKINWSFSSVFNEVFLRVNMHSFFMFGVFVYLGGFWLLFGMLWLATILLIDFVKILRNYVFNNNRFEFRLNKKLFYRIKLLMASKE